jgi:hypothetical protein
MPVSTMAHAPKQESASGAMLRNPAVMVGLPEEA